MASKRISKVRTAGKAIAAPEHERKTKREERRDPMLFFFSAFLSPLGARLSWRSPSALSLFESPLRLRDDAASSALSLAPVACRWKGGFFGSRGGAKRKGKRGEKPIEREPRRIAVELIEKRALSHRLPLSPMKKHKTGAARPPEGPADVLLRRACGRRPLSLAGAFNHLQREEREGEEPSTTTAKKEKKEPMPFTFSLATTLASVALLAFSLPPAWSRRCTVLLSSREGTKVLKEQKSCAAVFVDLHQAHHLHHDRFPPSTSGKKKPFLLSLFPRTPPPAGNHHGTLRLPLHRRRLLRHDPLPAGLPVQAPEGPVPDQGKKEKTFFFLPLPFFLFAHLCFFLLLSGIPKPPSPPLPPPRSTTPTSTPRAPFASTSSRSSGRPP